VGAGRAQYKEHLQELREDLGGDAQRISGTASCEGLDLKWKDTV
jgi:hypothetical protein